MSKSYTKFGTPVITIPEKMDVINKKGNHILVKTLTKKGNLKTQNGEKAIDIKTDKNENDVVVNSVGEKLIRNIYKKQKKLESYIKKFNVDDEINKFEKTLNKKPRKPRKKKEVVEEKKKKHKIKNLK